MSEGPPSSDSVPRSTRSRRSSIWLLAVSLAVVVLGWIVVLPPSSGPDEPSHVVRSAGLVRGAEDAGLVEVIFSASYELPAWVGWPEPACWAFDLDEPVACATLLPEPEGTELRGTRAQDYPIWGHLLPGAATLLVDDAVGNRLARIAHAAIPTALLLGALVLAARRGRAAAVGVLFAATPVAFLNTATVNPSGLVIAGGIAMWIALALEPPRAVPPDPLRSWLLAAGWAAMILPRRDGLVYAGLILAIVLALGLRTVPELRRLLGVPQLVLVGASTVATVLWAVTSESADSALLLAALVLPIGGWALRSLLLRTGWSRRVLAPVLATGALVTAIAAVAWAQWRDPTLDTVRWRAIVAETGSDLHEAIGLLGWLDAPMPESVLLLFVLALGALVGAAALVAPERLAPAAVVFVVGLLLSWWLTASRLEGNPQYWQGRYYLPLLAGIPILLATSPRLRRFERMDGLARGLAVVVAVVSVVTLANAVRRFAVGVDGTMAPWRWHTFGAAVSPLFPLVMVAAAWVVLLWSLDRLAEVSADAPDDTPVPTPTPTASDDAREPVA